jgi:hypothetical protein
MIPSELEISSGRYAPPPKSLLIRDNPPKKPFMGV